MTREILFLWPRALQVLQDLPKKQVEVMRCTMTESQAAMYSDLVNDFRQRSMLAGRTALPFSTRGSYAAPHWIDIAVILTIVLCCARSHFLV
jgi:hypothetical protein